MITQHQWMFLSSFKALRERMSNWPIINMAHLGTRAFEEIGGEVVQTTAFVVQKQKLQGFIGTYERLVDFDSQKKKQQAFLAAVQNPNLNYVYRTKQTNFEKIPGSPIVYQNTDRVIAIFQNTALGHYACPRLGMATADNSKFLRMWFEISINNIGFNMSNRKEAKDSHLRWFPYEKGGDYCKWYGNHLLVVDWQDDGIRIRNFTDSSGKIRSHNYNLEYIFKKGITWNALTSGNFSARLSEPGFLFDNAGSKMFFNEEEHITYFLALLSTPVVHYVLSVMNPTLNFQPGSLANLPIILINKPLIKKLSEENISLTRQYWNQFEYSWDFVFPFKFQNIAEHHRNWTVEAAFKQWQKEADDRFNQLKANEEELNRIFIDLYGLQDELSPEEEDKDVSIRRACLPRDIKAFMSYFIGCVFGRYSIDTPGLAYAGGGWDASKYKTFIPNEDDVILLTDDDYFGDNRDVMNRFKEFLTTTFGSENLNENLEFIADTLGKRGESSEEKIRAYLRDDFFKKDHLSTYQKRPIYWEFNSGRNGGFKALMYLHRYDRNTVAMIRTKYLHPLQEAYERKLVQLKKFEENEQQTRQKNKYKKQITTITKELDELIKYDEKLQHVANLHIDLDLDDGVLVNHAKAQADTKILTPLK